MTDVFWGEIPSGSTVTMNIVKASGNTTALNVRAINYKKGTSTTTNGDFFDDTLTPFRNIHHYSCYSRRTTSHEILNSYTTASSDESGATNIILSSRLCAEASGSGSSGNCTTPRNGFSAQSYYRNLYVRSDKVGTINSKNDHYDCPKVQESIRYSAGDASQPASEAGKYWPLDSQFSLATTYSSDWSVGVRAATTLKKTNDPDSVSTSCVNEDINKRLVEKGMNTQCLGYAKKPLPTGSCGSITDSNGRVRPMARLRRYRAVYPPMFQANGKVVDGALEGDEFYVPDRVVVNTLGIPTGSMIYGPKPCHFAWFDHEGMVNTHSNNDFQSHFTNGLPAYVGTNAYQRVVNGATISVNPDGLILPNTDVGGTPGSALNPPSCSTAIPLVVEMQGSPALIRLLTINSGRNDSIMLGGRQIQLSELHIRPIDPWVPEYLEDTSFQACVPLADPFTEPPLHFYSDTTGSDDYMAWCSKNYPTQNQNWAELNRKRKTTSSLNLMDATNGPLVNFSTGTAPVKHYTSHDSAASPPIQNIGDPLLYVPCAGTLTSCLDSIGVADTNYNQCRTYIGDATSRSTCDRTVKFDPNQDFRSFPLQASSTDIVSALTNDAGKKRNYGCTFSVHTDPTRIGKKIPLTGCCGTAGGVSILNTLLSASGNAHLEPYISTQFPEIRFCGSPVE
jgi:hypothetical protein